MTLLHLRLATNAPLLSREMLGLSEGCGSVSLVTDGTLQQW
jgi:hypothetical protein